MIKNIEAKIINKNKLTKEEINCFLDYIVSTTKEIIDDETLINKCDLAQGLIGRYLNSLNIRNYPCITNKCIMENVVGHSFIVACINNLYYIIDPSFIQFLYIEFKEKYINDLKIISKSPFEYAVKYNKNFTKELIEKGYIELNDESAYWYGNLFYHTLTNINHKYIFNDIPGNVYIKKFLKGNEKLRKYNYPEIKEELKKEEYYKKIRG